MIGDDRTAVWAHISALARGRGQPMSPQDACLACVGALRMSGAGLSLVLDRHADDGERLAGKPGRLEPLHAVGEMGLRLLEAELTSGDGPCLEAVRTDEPVLAEDLSDHDCQRRWPMFTAMSQADDVQAVFAFPLTPQTAPIGVLVLCRDRPATLTAHQHTQGLLFAEAAMALLLDASFDLIQHPASQPLVPEQDVTATYGAAALDFTLPAGVLALGPQVHQAAGMVSVQMDCSPSDALTVLRAHAFAHDEPLTQVARQVVARILRFTTDPPPRPEAARP
ncbi:GAF and ANTAR domain-containing protein [Spirillospora sp. NPDC048911]|uniref:GAF and ANTAR domain-containing protein n=1 Tax=Spirillospora sp. NPDC048911 TaxID=3364527 RepID=UPI00371957D6